MLNDNQIITDVESSSGNSAKHFLFGIGLIVIASIVLYWNEGRSVREAGAIAEAELITVDLSNIHAVDSAFNNNVIYAKGLAKTSDVLTDPQFDITITAIGLKRKIQFYQWVESSETERVKNAEGIEQDITTFTYEKEWTRYPVNSSDFHLSVAHMNSVILQAPVRNEEWLAKKVSFGAYSLPQFMIASIDNEELLSLNLTVEQINKINEQLLVAPVTNTAVNAQKVAGAATPIQDTQAMPASRQQKRIHVQENSIYLGYNQIIPQIGDVKVEFIKTPDTKISLVAQVNGDTFAPYIASNGNTFSELSSLQESKQVIFQNAKDSNSKTTWIIRGVGIISVIVGLKLLLAPIIFVCSFIPIFGSIVEVGAVLLAVLFGLSWSLIVIATSWLRFRPVLAISLFVIAGALIVFTIWKGYAKKKSNAFSARV